MQTEPDTTRESDDILIVDDEVSNLKLLAEILVKEGYRVRPANGPQLAIDSATSRPPKLILLDVMMPEMDGFEVCRLLKRNDRTRDIPIIFISALREPHDRVRGFEAGGVDFVAKPVDELEVLARVRAHVNLRNLQLDMEEQVRRRTEEVYAREARLREAQRMAKIGSWEEDLTTDMLTWSDEVLRIFEIDPARFDGKLESLFDVIHPDDREMVEEAHIRSVKDGRPQRLEHRLLMPDGRIKYVRGQWETERSPEGVPRRVVKTVQDITEHVRAERESAELRVQLARLGRASILNELAASLAHEINQPLGAILRNAEAAALLLRRDPPDIAEVEDITADIRSDVDRANAVIGSMRDLIKRREMEFEALPVDDLVDRAVDLVKAEVRGRGSRLDVWVPAGLPPVRGDLVQLQQVLINLILNGLDAMDGRSGDKRIEVQARLANQEMVEVAVSDRGAGISDEARARLFAPLFTTKTNGLGMGLSIAKRCIESHGGRIWAENNPVGGATFKFTLKVAPEGTG